jgi:hypothetical protein
MSNRRPLPRTQIRGQPRCGCDHCGCGGQGSIAGDTERGDDVTVLDHGGGESGLLVVLAVAG